MNTDHTPKASALDAGLRHYENPNAVSRYFRQDYHKVRVNLAAKMAENHLQSDKAPAGPIYEIACGGHSMLAGAQTGNRRIIGSDYARKPLLEGKKSKEFKEILHFDATKPWPIKTSSASTVMSGEFIEHMYDPEFLFAESNRVLKPGGMLIVTTPNLLTFQDRLRGLIGRPSRQIKVMKGGVAPYLHDHIRPFAPSSLRVMFEASGFEVVDFKSNFTCWVLQSGKSFNVRWPARLFPGLGSSLIMSGRKIQKPPQK